MSHVHSDTLAPRAGVVVQFGGGEADGGDARLRRCTDAKRRWQDRIAAGGMQIVERRTVSAGQPPQFGDDVGGRKRCAHNIPNRRGSHSDSAGM
jgi:hypothetical protein